MKVELTPELIRIATRNGINKACLWERLKKGWSEVDATTTPPGMPNETKRAERRASAEASLERGLLLAATPETRKKAKENRKRVKQIRQAILQEIDRQETLKCVECSTVLHKGVSNRCECPASLEIKRLGAKLETLKKDIERGDYAVLAKPFEGITRDTLTVDIYKRMKAKQLSDTAILKIIGWHTVGLTKWKHANGLIPTDPTKVEPVKVEVAEVETVEVVPKYTSMLDDGCHTEADIEPILDYETILENERANHREDIAKAQFMLHKKDAELSRLRPIEQDYRKLEVDYLNAERELKRLNVMLDRLKHTEQINLWLMEQKVEFHKQLNEVFA